jgi:hypothetical protein
MPELLAPFSLPVDTKQVIVKGTTGQTANLLELQDSSAVAKLTVTATGAVKVATTSTLGTSELLRVGAVAHPLSTAVMEIKVPTSTIGLVVEGASALSFQNSAGSVYLTCSEFLMYAPGMDCTFATGTFDTGVISSISSAETASSPWGRPPIRTSFCAARAPERSGSTRLERARVPADSLFTAAERCRRRCSP